MSRNPPASVGAPARAVGPSSPSSSRLASHNPKATGQARSAVAAHAPAPAAHPATVSTIGGTPAAASRWPAASSTGLSNALARESSIPGSLTPRRPGVGLHPPGIVLVAIGVGAHLGEWQQYAQLAVFGRVEHTMLNARRDEGAVLGVGHRVMAGGQPFLGGPDPRVVAGLAPLHQLPRRLDLSGIHELVHHIGNRPHPVGQQTPQSYPPHGAGRPP